ncbi:MAG: HD domain-containing protein [Spirochaetales bacterium]|jgi:predicted hydrolase (HD superfamily)
MDRAKAISVWREYNSEDSLFRHALSVEAAMRHFALKYGEDEDFWGIVGLLHDVDYQQFPEEHLAHSRSILEKAGYGEDLVHAVLSHGWGLCSEVEPTARMEKVLFAVDELTGFIAACAYVRPSRSVLDMEVRSVKKKWGAVNFAAGVRRDVIEKGAAMMGVPLDDLISETILALRGAAEAVGLKGNL